MGGLRHYLLSIVLRFEALSLFTTLSQLPHVMFILAPSQENLA